VTNWARMAALVASLPDLDGAACAGEYALFDSTIPGWGEVTGKPARRHELDNARAAALRLCAACPALDDCRVWLDGLRPSRRPRGVIAGQVVKP
jgi:WhiB family transcriptional regulator, redox-sensing transcriptional regulator